MSAENDDIDWEMQGLIDAARDDFAAMRLDTPAVLAVMELQAERVLKPSRLWEILTKPKP